MLFKIDVSVSVHNEKKACCKYKTKQNLTKRDKPKVNSEVMEDRNAS